MLYVRLIISDYQIPKGQIVRPTGRIPSIVLNRDANVDAQGAIAYHAVGATPYEQSNIPRPFALAILNYPRRREAAAAVETLRTLVIFVRPEINACVLPPFRLRQDFI